MVEAFFKEVYLENVGGYESVALTAFGEEDMQNWEAPKAMVYLSSPAEANEYSLQQNGDISRESMDPETGEEIDGPETWDPDISAKQSAELRDKVVGIQHELELRGEI